MHSKNFDIEKLNIILKELDLYGIEVPELLDSLPTIIEEKFQVIFNHFRDIFVVKISPDDYFHFNIDTFIGLLYFLSFPSGVLYPSLW